MCTGEAEYVDDIPRRHDEVHPASVVSTQAHCDIKSVTPQEKLFATNQNQAVGIIVAKRLTYLVQYKLTGVDMKLYCDSGYSFMLKTITFISATPGLLVPIAILTDKPSNTYVRAPGSVQGHAAVENVMEHLAHELGLDPLEFRMMNMVGKTSHPLQEIIKNLRKSSEFDKRKIDIAKFNKVVK